METPIEPPCQTKQKGKEHEEGKGGAILVKGRDITDLDGLGASCFHLDGVGVDNLLFTPFGVPFLQINGVGTDADENAVMEIDAVALEVGGEMACIGIGYGLRGVAGTKHKHDREHCAQTDSVPRL